MGAPLERILDADLPRIATAIESLAEEMHTANLIALAYIPPMERRPGNYPRRMRALKEAAKRLKVDKDAHHD